MPYKFIGDRKWYDHRRSCLKRGLVNELTRELFDWLRAQPCIYCAQPATGVDRVKNGFGYTKLNSVPCCKTCNGMKSVKGIKAFVIAVNATARYCPDYPAFKQRWVHIREELCRFTNTNAPDAVSDKNSPYLSSNRLTRSAPCAAPSSSCLSVVPPASPLASTEKAAV